MRVTATQFSLCQVTAEAGFWRRVERTLGASKDAASSIVLFPEYFTLSWLVFRNGKNKFIDNLSCGTDLVADFCLSFQRIVDRFGISVVAGTIPFHENGRTVNRSFLFRPGLEHVYQDKIKMTRFEAEHWSVTGGSDGIKTFEIDGVLCAVVICYDIEFSRVTEVAAREGVQILFVPSCTDDVHGYWRVRLCAQARTVEHQCYVVMSSVVGGHPQHEEIGSHFGRGGIFSPSDVGFVPGGVVALGTENIEGQVTADIDLGLLEKIRRDGTVLNLRDRNRGQTG